MVDLAEVNSSVTIDAVTKRQPDQPAGASVNASVGASPEPSELAVNDAVQISAEGLRAADALAGTDALADRLDTGSPSASIAPAAITNDQGDDGLIEPFTAPVDQPAPTENTQSSQLRVDTSGSALEDRVNERNSAIGEGVRLDPTASAAESDESFPASNQRASVEIDQAGNDELSQTEANRTLGQVVDVFA
jgi:hypothetical protein